MSKKRYTIRLYQRHDMDLITFCELYEVSFARAAYCVLKSFVKGETFVLAIPSKKMNSDDELKHLYHKKLILDTEKDKDVIALLENVLPGYKNSFIKNLLRQYIRMPATELYMKSEEAYEEIHLLENSLKKGTRVANAGNLSRWDRRNKETWGFSEEQFDSYLFELIFNIKEKPVTESVKKKKQKKKMGSDDSKRKFESVSMTEKDDPEKIMDKEAETVNENNVSIEEEHANKGTNAESENSDTVDDDELTDLFSSLMGM